MISFLDATTRLIGARSWSLGGNEEIASYAQSLMSSVGFKTNLQQVTHSQEGISKRQFNVVGTLGDPLVDVTTKKGLLISCNLDTSTPGIYSQWTECGGDPLKATVANDSIYGLGASYSKLNFLCILKACERYADKLMRRPLYVVATAGSERGGLGAKFLKKSLFVNPKQVIVSAPTGLNVVGAQKGSIIYKLSIHYNQLERDARGYNTRIQVKCTGRGSDGGYASYGINAIETLQKFMCAVRSANFGVKITEMNGGDCGSKVPDWASVVFFIPSSSFEDFKRYHRESLPDVMGESLSQIQIEYGGLGDSGMKVLADNVFAAVEEAGAAFVAAKDSMLSDRDERFDIDMATVSLSRIYQGAGVLNLNYDIRVLPSSNIESFEALLREKISALSSKFTSLMFRLERECMVPAMDVPESSQFMAELRQASNDLQFNSKAKFPSLCTDASHYVSDGCEVVIFGPGICPGNTHSPNESVPIEHLDKAVHFYDRIIERYCL